MSGCFWCGGSATEDFLGERACRPCLGPQRESLSRIAKQIRNVWTDTRKAPITPFEEYLAEGVE